MSRAAPLLTCFALIAITGLAACGPVPVAQAERSCLSDARLALGPRSEVNIGVGAVSGQGLHTTGSVGIAMSSDSIMGRDPADVFNRCVMRRSGQMPTRALYDQPGWQGA